MIRITGEKARHIPGIDKSTLNFWFARLIHMSSMHSAGSSCELLLLWDLEILATRQCWVWACSSRMEQDHVADLLKRLPDEDALPYFEQARFFPGTRRHPQQLVRWSTHACQARLARTHQVFVVYSTWIYGVLTQSRDRLSVLEPIICSYVE